MAVREETKTIQRVAPELRNAVGEDHVFYTGLINPPWDEISDTDEYMEAQYLEHQEEWYSKLEEQQKIIDEEMDAYFKEKGLL